jgi:hypothetical protein
LCGYCGTPAALNQSMDILPRDSKEIELLAPVFYNANIDRILEKGLVMLPQVHRGLMVVQSDRHTGGLVPLVCMKCNSGFSSILIIKNLDVNFLICL